MTEFNLHKTLGYAIIHTSRLLNNNMNLKMCSICPEGESITREQGAVLLLLSKGRDQEMIQSDLAELMDKSKSAVLRTIDILEKKGYVTRMSVPDDRRKNRLEVTDKGKEIARYVVEMIETNNKLLIDEIGEQDMCTFFKVLEVIQRRLESDQQKLQAAIAGS